MSKIVEALRRDGFWYSPVPWPHAQEFLNHLKAENSYPGHVMPYGEGIARSLDDTLAIPPRRPSHIVAQYEYACHTITEFHVRNIRQKRY